MSSKFSRRHVIQQPPPVCRSKPKPLPLPPPSNPIVKFVFAWNGLCSDYVERSMSYTVALEPNRPAEAYVFHDSIGENYVLVTCWREDGDTYGVSAQILGSTWYANAYGHVPIPDVATFDSGEIPAESTLPPDQSATFRVYFATS